MKREFLEYLMAIEMSDVVINRVKSIYSSCQAICPEEILDIFVEDFIDDAGRRNYGCLWFFSETYGMEAINFIRRDDFDITPIKNRIRYLSVKKQDYDWDNAGEKSRLNIEFLIDTGFSGNLRAAKNNCDFLKGRIMNRIIPNLLK